MYSDKDDRKEETNDTQAPFQPTANYELALFVSLYHYGEVFSSEHFLITFFLNGVFFFGGGGVEAEIHTNIYTHRGE